MISEQESLLLRHLDSAVTEQVFTTFVRENGRLHTVGALPKGIRSGRFRMCFMNSYRLMRRHGKRMGLLYVEGYALSNTMDWPVLHAWCVDESGKVLDRTWGHGAAYFGIEFKTEYLYSVMRKREKGGDVYYGLIDDMKGGFPLLKSLRDQPQVWRHSTES